MQLAESEYQLMQLGDMARNHYMLDKKSGRVWQRVCNGEIKNLECNGLTIWDEMYVSGITEQDTPVARLYDAVQKYEQQKLQAQIEAAQVETMKKSKK